MLLLLSLIYLGVGCWLVAALLKILHKCAYLRTQYGFCNPRESVTSRYAGLNLSLVQEKLRYGCNRKITPVSVNHT